MVKATFCVCVHTHALMCALMAYGDVEVQLCSFLTSVLGGGKWSASHPGQFILSERASSTHSLRGWVARPQS